MIISNSINWTMHTLPTWPFSKFSLCRMCEMLMAIVVPELARLSQTFSCWYSTSSKQYWGRGVSFKASSTASDDWLFFQTTDFCLKWKKRKFRDCGEGRRRVEKWHKSPEYNLVSLPGKDKLSLWSGNLGCLFFSLRNTFPEFSSVLHTKNKVRSFILSENKYPFLRHDCEIPWGSSQMSCWYTDWLFLLENVLSEQASLEQFTF